MTIAYISSMDPSGKHQRVAAQKKRTDEEAIILREYNAEVNRIFQMSNEDLSRKLFEEVDEKYCKMLGITDDQLTHKLKILGGLIEDDEREWREQKYGRQ